MAEFQSNDSNSFASRLATCRLIYKTIIQQEEQKGETYTAQERLTLMRQTLRGAGPTEQGDEKETMTLSKACFNDNFAAIFQMEKAALVTETLFALLSIAVSEHKSQASDK